MPRGNSPITVEPRPGVGQHFHRCHERGHEIRPEYRGPDGLTGACTEADAHSLEQFHWGGRDYAKTDEGWWVPLTDAD